MIVRLRGVNKVRAKGRIYYYHRASRVRLRSAPGTTDFVIELARFNARRKTDAAPQRRQAGSLGALVAGYRGSPEFTRLAEHTLADYQRVFNYLAPLDGLPLVQLDGAAVIEIRDRAYAHRKRRFANHVLQVLGTVFNWGRPRRLSPGNPAAGIGKIPRPRDLPKANRAWTPAESAAVLGSATGGLKLAVALGMFAGMRIGDASRVTWSIYDGANLEWSQGKTGDIVWMPAGRELRALLDAAPRPATTIVTGALGRPLKEAGLAKAFRMLIVQLERAGRIGDGLTFHGLRHTAGKTLADLGADPRMIQALLGQRSLSMAIHYSQEGDRRRAAAAAVHALEQPQQERGANEKLQNRGKVLQNRPRQDG
jgi:integrase